MTVCQADNNKPRNTISLPDRVSTALSPITEKSVRHSSRLNRNDGFCVVRLDREHTKKRKISVVKIDGRTGEAGPVPLAVLQVGASTVELLLVSFPMKLFYRLRNNPPNKDTTDEINAI